MGIVMVAQRMCCRDMSRSPLHGTWTPSWCFCFANLFDPLQCNDIQRVCRKNDMIRIDHHHHHHPISSPIFAITSITSGIDRSAPHLRRRSFSAMAGACSALGIGNSAGCLPELSVWPWLTLAAGENSYHSGFQTCSNHELR